MDDTDAQANAVWSELEGLALPAREHRRLLPETRSNIILRLCLLAPLSVKELSLLLSRSEAYVGDAIRPLVNNGSLTFLYPDQPRHPKQKYKSSQNAVNETFTPPANQPASDEAVEEMPPEQWLEDARARRIQWQEQLKKWRGDADGDGSVVMPADLPKPLQPPAPPASSQRAPAPTPAPAPAPARARARAPAQSRYAPPHPASPVTARPLPDTPAGRALDAARAGRTIPKTSAPALPAKPPAVPRAQPDESPPAITPSAFPNRLTNVVVAVVIGILLATIRVTGWPIYALVAALALSLSHIVANSSQYEQFEALQSSPNKRRLAFVLLKSSVSLIEILLVYFVTSTFTN